MSYRRAARDEQIARAVKGEAERVPDASSEDTFHAVRREAVNNAGYEIGGVQIVRCVNRQSGQVPSRAGCESGLCSIQEKLEDHSALLINFEEIARAIEREPDRTGQSGRESTLCPIWREFNDRIAVNIAEVEIASRCGNGARQTEGERRDGDE